MGQKRRKDKMKGSTVRKIVILIIILALVIAFGMKYLQKRVTSRLALTEENTVQSAEVTTGSISTTVTGSGTLADEDSEKVEIPSSVTLNKIYVETGDTVAEGDLLATVDSASVLSAMADLQSEIAELDEDLADAKEDEAAAELTTAVSGRVKAIYAQEDDAVASVMYENGALILLSLDGYLAVDVETDVLKAGDEVTVKVGDTSYTGTVEKLLKGKATVLISDEKAALGETAEVSKDSTSIGSGELYIHESLAVTGYAGTVDAIKVSLNESVDADDTLITLEDTGYSANYSAILNERNDLEEQLQDLIKIYKEGAVYATCAGTVTEITEASANAQSSSVSSAQASSSGINMSSMGNMSGTGSTSSASSAENSDSSVIAICPDTEMTISVSVDETNILSIQNGQTATVSVDSLSDQTFTGEVTSVEREGTSSNGVTTYTVRVTLAKESSMLSGMSASVTITIEGVENALLVPADAVNKTSSSAYVYTTYDEENDELGGMVEVTIGISNSNYVEIKEGLSAGDTVYYKESQSDNNAFGGFGGMGDFSNMPSGGGGNMPSGGFSGMPSGGGGNMPSGGFSGMPSGGK